MQDDNLLRYKIALEMIPHIGSITAKRLIAYSGGVEEVFVQSKKALLKIPGVGEALAYAVSNQKVLDRADKEIEFLQRYEIKPLYYLDEDYPDRLKQCDDSPILLYYKGNTSLSHEKVLSIVGTRNATEYGRELCATIVEGLRLKGYSILIISGLAHGIDTAAHRNAIKNGFPTVAVLAHGLNMIYPSANRGLAKEMLANGALVTDFITGTMPERNNFLRRNRIIAGLADATLVVESGEKGGALVTADLAFSYSRDVLACPGRATDKFSLGCNALIRTNRAALVESAEDVELALNWSSGHPSVRSPQQLSIFRDFTSEEQLIVSVLKEVDSESIDTISFATGLSMPATSATLLTLEFDGVVKSFPGKIYSLSNSYALR
jgi:DNA processing protein